MMFDTSTPSGKVIGIFTGKPRPRWPGKPESAIDKHSAIGPSIVTRDGFSEDIQADLTVHGGPEKALHHYATDHMKYWQETFPSHAKYFKPGCFGENIATTGLAEENLCLGDILSLGSAKVQACQGRQPCWKLNAHMEIEELAFHFQKTARTGWYYRIIEDGSVTVGDTMEVLERFHPHWSLQRLILARFNKSLDEETAKELSNMEVLSEHWRASFAKKSIQGFTENTDRRLKGV